jgi:hypothetical protein
MLKFGLMAGFIYGIVALFCAIVALAVIRMSDNKRPGDPDVIAAAREEELKREKAECL